MVGNLHTASIYVREVRKCCRREVEADRCAFSFPHVAGKRWRRDATRVFFAKRSSCELN